MLFLGYSLAFKADMWPAKSFFTSIWDPGTIFPFKYGPFVDLSLRPLIWCDEDEVENGLFLFDVDEVNLLSESAHFLIAYDFLRQGSKS